MTFHENLREINLTGFWLIFDWGKNEDEDEKISESEYYFWTLHLDSNMNFNGNLRKENWSHFWSIFMIKDEDDKSWGNEFDFGTLHPKIRLYLNFHENLSEANI